jgi:protein-disulfide isomerase
MNKPYVFGVVAGLASLGMLGLGYAVGTNELNRSAAAAPAVEATQAPAAQLDTVAVEQIVREYLLTNPEVLIEMQTSLETKHREQQRVAQLSAIQQSAGEIFNASYDGVVGNAEGNVAVVEFFDYNCGYCKRALADMDAMVAADPELRFVMKEFPILGPDSQKAHVVSMAFRGIMPDKYEEFHRQLMGAAGTADEASAIEVALSLGADEAALRKEMENPAIMQAFEKTYELASKLSITGTPSYVVGDEVVFGALGQDLLEQKVANVRTCQSATC